ncbi:MAG: DUF255 domain-containing protein [Thermofilaceae archaeon]
MIRALTLLVLLTTLFSLVLAKPIHWMSYEEALAEAPRSGKLVYVYFYSETCPACRLMEEVLNDSRVTSALNTGFIPVRVNVKARPDLASAFMVPGTPAHLFVCPNGTPLGGSLGYKDVEGFLELLKIAQDQARQRCSGFAASSKKNLSEDNYVLELTMAFTFSLLLGLTTAFSPCILPLLPIVYLIASKGGRRGAAWFTLGLFSLSSLIGTVASGFLLSARSFAEPIAYALLLFAGLVLLFDRLGKWLSYITSRVATTVTNATRTVNSFILGATATIIWGPCAAPMITAAFALTTFAARSPVEAAGISVAFAAGFALTVYTLTVGFRKARSLANRAKALKKVNKALGLAMIITSLLHFVGLY